MKNNLTELLNNYSREQIEELYIKKNLPKNIVAQQLNLTQHSLSKLLREYNIKKSKELVKALRESTCVDKYGVADPNQLVTIKNKISEANKNKSQDIVQKGKNTKLLKYGNANYNNSEKNKATKLKRFGDENYNNRDKYKETMQEKYGVENGFQLKSTIENNLNNLINDKNYSKIFRELFLDKDKSIEFLKNKEYTYFDLMNIFNAPYYTVQVWVTRLELKDYIKYNFEGKSHYEDEIENWLKNELHIDNIIKHDRKIIEGQELDIYIPDKNVAIEFNGNYWHSSEVINDKFYHFNKSYLCEQKGIRLIHIYEYQWEDSVKREILKSIIKNALGKNENILYARKCQIKELNKKDVEEFSKLNSLHAHRNASIYLGLFYNDELVELMSFGKAFFSRDNSIDYECIRSITKINTTVVGGMNKLFKYFINKYNPNKILYYVDYNTHNGNSMSKLGFKFINYSKGGIINISNSKETIEKFGYIFNRKPEKHREIQEYVKQGKIFTIYDAGVKKYMWDKN